MGIVFLLVALLVGAVSIENAYASDESEPITYTSSGSAEHTPSKTIEDINEGTKSSSNDEPPELTDSINDGFFGPIIAADPSCIEQSSSSDGTSSIDSLNSNNECFEPPESTIEKDEVVIDVTALYGGDDPSCMVDDDEGEERDGQCPEQEKTKKISFDKHWGSDDRVLKMRDTLRNAGNQDGNDLDPHRNDRPPVFLMPGLASTRLVSWKYKSCANALLSDVKVQDYVWMNINMIIQMATIDGSCFLECMTLGFNQTDMEDARKGKGCKLRPEEGLNAIASLAPNSVGSNMLVGGKNTVYAWLIQWLTDNLGYDVSSIVGLPYDWRLSPDIMEKRDGFLTLTRRRIEAAVASNGQPGIMVAHSMGNNVFRYFLEWLRDEMHQEAYQRYKKKAKKRRERDTVVTGWIGPHDTLDSTKLSSIPPLDNADGIDQDTLWEFAKVEGDENWLDWINEHIWTYIGLSAPLIGAMNPLRAVLSGENMGMPMSDDQARTMEITFGSTHTINPISTKSNFCDNDLFGHDRKKRRSNLACLEELIDEIDTSDNESADGKDAWANFPSLKHILKDRVDWNTDFSPISVREEHCDKARVECTLNTTHHFSAEDVQTGEIFDNFNVLFREKGEPMKIKKEQLEASWWHHPFPNLLESTWERPHIKHVVMAYGVDMPTEVGYVYKKETMDHTEENEESNNEEFDGIPLLQTVISEEANGYLFEESMLAEPKSLTEGLGLKRSKPKRRPLNNGDNKGTLHHSGDGSVPYLSLAWAQTWLLHATRAMRVQNKKQEPGENALSSIKITKRPKGGSDWLDVDIIVEESIDEKKKRSENTDDGTTHPHGTKYKPEMYRFQSKGRSRTTGMEYTTSVIEAIGVEHKETTRNYDILAAVFTDVLNHMHDDFDLV